MNKEIKRNILSMQGFYLLTFFGVGSLYPLLSVYLSEVEHLNGYQIGTIMSISPIIMIFFQPLWGMVSDKLNAPIKILTATTFIAGFFALGYITFNGYYWIFIIATCVAIFQSAIIPISDSLSIKYTSKVKVNYGNVRLFGSLGFGLAVFIMGRLSEWNPKIIFISFFASLLIASVLALKMPSESASKNQNLLSGVKEILVHKRFLIFLGITFLIFGPNLANNNYFGLFIENRGGTYTGIGIAFLIAVLSEIPFMKAAGSWIHRFGLLQIATLAGAVSLIRWLLYFMEPSLWFIYATAVIQGFSIGLFIPAGLQYIRDITPVHITATAITLYSAIGNGLGNWFSTFVGGIIYEEFNINSLYLFFSVLSILGIILNLWLLKEEKGHATFSAAKN
ncbi:MFS transporter [Bacillus sp. DTU_2020_1000418_1_SI_GHA_SEK_038]|uniref:MFS transporter n=1 Tax=Bacillus sp. DTU_2020_1000418_1_SI_GHA_SEK_038 TaxID=3077585 RepID=UPI0028EC22C7|nr:MFS transporter [Bacillus sp. DTU_2020_1000418_1_SI_GHA_SEK_038]WNS73499.1 MFS transporter [Bacillus sp. DTU_2020_1000418_1_SI_GHA_SEK_038]